MQTCGSPLPHVLQCQNCILPFGRTIPDNILLCKTLPFSTSTIVFFFCWSTQILFNLSNGLAQSASSVSLSILWEFCVILWFLILSIFFLSPEPCSIYIFFLPRYDLLLLKFYEFSIYILFFTITSFKLAHPLLEGYLRTNIFVASSDKEMLHVVRNSEIIWPVKAENAATEEGNSN